MARKRRKKVLESGSDFLKVSLGIGIVALFAFYIKENLSKKAPPPPIVQEKVVKTESKKAESQAQEKRVQKSKALSGLLPAEAWQDDYLVLKAPLGKPDSELYLIAMGVVAEGKTPDKIKDPGKLRPRLVVAKKEAEDFVEITRFDFETSGTSVGGLQSKNLKGIPRIKSADIIDLDGDGMPEIRVTFDTATDLAEAIGFLRWNGSELSWLKTKDKSGEVKVALWITGASPSDSQQIDLKKEGNAYEIIQKYGQADPQHPEKGFEWKTTVWKIKNGVLQVL